ncbi:hypothetical protein ACP51X_001050 [Vibrio vulnificus]
MFVLGANDRFVCVLFDLSEGHIEDQIHDSYLEYPEIRNVPFKRVRIVRQLEYEVWLFLGDQGVRPEEIALWDEITVADVDTYRHKADERGWIPFPYDVDGTYFFILYPKR